MTLYGFRLDSRPAPFASEIVFGEWTILGLMLFRGHSSSPTYSKLMSLIRRSVRAIEVYVAIVVVIATALLAFSTSHDVWFAATGEATAGGLLTFVVIGLGLEFAEHRLAMGAATGSIAFIVYMGAALIFGPTWCALLAATSITAAHALHRKKAIKIAFNVGQTVIALLLASNAYLVLGGTLPPESVLSIGPFLGLVLTYFAVNSTAVSIVIALSEGRSFFEVWSRNTLSLALYDLMASTLALAIAWVVAKSGPLALFVVVLPILFVRHVYMVNLQLQATSRELLDLMVRTIEARDRYTSGHSQRVARLARALAKSLRLGFKEVENVSTAALLHDVGKIHEEFAPILRKEGRLTAEERALMESHPIRSAELVGTISSLHGQVYRCVRHHHENFDGSGYPDGLAGEQIPVGARIIMVADTVDAMTTDRPYRKALPFEKVFLELQKYSGKQFDPQVVHAFHKSLEVKRIIDLAGSQMEGYLERDRERVVQLAVR